MTRLRIPPHVVCRIYGNSLAVVMNVATRTTVLLQHEALAWWRQLATSTEAPEGDGGPAVQGLVELGMLEAEPGSDANGPRAAPESAEAATTGVPTVDMAVVNYWAFKNRIPITGHFELTGRCNLRCQHCYCLFDRKRDTLDTEAVVRIVDDLERAGTLGLVLTGGEIFARADIMDILDYLARRRFVLRLNTNGTLLTEARVEQLAKHSNIYRVHVSLYGSVAQVHDGITQSPGSFDKTLRSIRLMRAAGLNLRVNCSVIRSNLDDVPRLHDLVTGELGIPVHFDPFIFPRDDGAQSNTSGALDPAQHLQLLEFMRQHELKHADAAGEQAKPKLCKAAFAFFSICEDGRVYPCLKMKRFYANPLGDLRTQSFRDIWEHSALTQAVRESLDRKLRQCDICNVRI
jgi:radical SAM protein with 4Fe4S-binding SPASM domain